MSGDPFCASQLPREDETIVVRGGGGLANAVVRIVGSGQAPSSPPEAPVVVEATGCLYRPRVVVAQAGQRVEFRSGDRTVHKVHGWSGETEFSQPVGPGDRRLEVRAPAAGQLIRVKCDAHPWMSAMVVATDNPFFAITDLSGRYVLRGVPPGRYTVEVWHEAFPPSRTEVTVGTGTVAADFVLGDHAAAAPAGDYVAAGGDKCQLAVNANNPVVQACKEGGIKKAKSVMKALMKKGKALGLKFECDDCHKDEAAGNWTLTKDAPEKFKKLLAATREPGDPRSPP
jgi:plastocyanin